MIATAASLLRGSPAWRLTVALGAALVFALLMLRVAQDQPRFGLDFAVQGDRVTVSGAPVAGLGGERTVEAVAITDGSGRRVPITPATLTEEPNFLPDFPSIRSFMADQGRIAAILRDDPRLVVRADDGTVRTVALWPLESARLPFPFWYQMFVGLVIYAISVWLWAVASGNRANLYFALSGLGMLLSAATAAIYSSRELAIGMPLFRILGIVNELGASLFGIAMINLFLTYPRRIASRSAQAALTAFLILWTAAAAARWVPSPNWGNNGTTVFEMAVIVAAVIRQYFATRGDPVGRAALRWLGNGVVIGAGAFVGTSAVPLVLNLPPVVDQGMAFGFFLIIIAGIAMGLRRDKLFAVDQLSYSVLYYSGLAIAFILVDIGLLTMLGSQRLAGVVTGAVLLPLLYLPLRDRAIAWIGGSRKTDTLSLLEDVTRMTFARAGDDRVALWRLALDHAFSPLAIEPGEAVDTVQLEQDGAAMAIPEVAGSPPLRLRMARRGRGLFRQQDGALAQRMVAMAAHADAERAAYVRGVDEERARVARDLHDDLAGRLMDGLALDRVEPLREAIRSALVEVRSIVNGRRAAPMLVADALADARVEAADRLEVAGIALDWVPLALPGELGPQQVRALESTVREAITNITRHSGASCVTVTAAVEADALAMTIRDNGCGWGFGDRGGGRGGTAPPPEPGHGLRNVRYRIGSAGGEADFDAGPGGFAIVLRLPVAVRP